MNFFKKKYFIENEIIKFHISDNITKQVADFYNIKPFPNYDNNESKHSLVLKGNKSILAYQFKKFIGFNKNVLAYAGNIDLNFTIEKLHRSTSIK